MVALGFCFERGRGVALDSTRAAGLFLRARAAAAGSAGAQASLARCFDLAGVAEDLARPAELLSSASTPVGHASARPSLASCSRDGDKTAAAYAIVSFEELPRTACVKAAAALRLVCEGYRWVADTGVWERAIQWSRIGTLTHTPPPEFSLTTRTAPSVSVSTSVRSASRCIDRRRQHIFWKVAATLDQRATWTRWSCLPQRSE